jgi:hypothetical protein
MEMSDLAWALGGVLSGALFLGRAVPRNPPILVPIAAYRAPPSRHFRTRRGTAQVQTPVKGRMP